ncbi:MAG TPA: S53 family peptidase [Thermoleophilaceae bacterium]|nr:S53 family peptidase [Thermoleophilaceae bacterium]
MANFFARRRLGAYGLACVLAVLVVAPAQAAGPRIHSFCAPVLPGFAHCDAAGIKKRHAAVAHAATLGSIPYGPADIQDAYGLTSAASQYGADQTVAIVDAYDLPTAESDLAYYRSHYGLPPCTTANGCFKKVNQYGGTSSYPAEDTGWGDEIALDLDAVSATCPHCHILLVEATSASSSNLAAAVNRAALMGATQISNSYGSSEGPGETTFESYYDHPGIAITVSSGDDGYGVQYPAASEYVTAVGGTSLYKDSSTRGWSESAWDGAGSGCSGYIAKPSWQTDTDCPGRAVADVSAVADPNTGIATYDSSDGGWWQVGGTSLASPVVAAAYALTGSSAAAPGFAYANSGWFIDVTSGSNGSCVFAYLCTALAGFDGPTGLGTPNSAHPTEPPPTGGGESAGGTTGGSGGNTGGSGGTTTPPASPAAPAPAPVQAKVLSSVAVRGASSRPARNGRFRVKIACGTGPACSGVLSLQIRLRGSALRTFGRARYSLAAGQTKWIVVRLSHYNLRLLQRKHRLRVYGTALDGDGTAAQSSFGLRAPKRSKARRHHR